MKKNKNKKTSDKKTDKKKVAKKTGLLSGAGKSLKKLGTGIGGLSTTQKVAGGALVALGLSYLAKRRGSNGRGSSSAAATPGLAADATAAEQSLATMDGGNI